MSQSCKTCKWLDVAPDKAGRITVRAGYAYKCLAPVPDAAALRLPESITRAFRFHWPPMRTHVGAANGADCPVWEARKK